eukprot:1453569-Prymnesium_polylepis.1
MRPPRLLTHARPARASLVLDPSPQRRVPSARAQIPQFRAYLRGPGMEAATEAQWAEELPPLVGITDKHGKPVTLMQKYRTYQANRRGKAKPLKRSAVCVETVASIDADAEHVRKPPLEGAQALQLPARRRPHDRRPD